MSAVLVLLVGCSDFDCPDGQARADGMCRPDTDGSLEPKTRTIWVSCSNNLIDVTPANVQFQSLLPWELTVDVGSGPILGGEPFGATFSAVAGFDEYFLYAAQGIAGGVSRAELIDLRATVHVRRGVTDGEDVTLGYAEIPWTCRYDRNGQEEPDGDFPACSAENDKLDGSNDDCIGLGGQTDPQNVCGRFVKIPTSSDCEPGGECERRGDPWPQSISPLEQCEMNGFCVIGPVEVPLTGALDGYVAADSGHVLFGWDDVSTGARVDQSYGRNDGVWILPEAVFEDPPGPNGMRWRIGDVEVAMECTMGVGSWGPFGVRSWNNMTSPAPDHALISFPIQEP